MKKKETAVEQKPVVKKEFVFDLTKNGGYVEVVAETLQRAITRFKVDFPDMELSDGNYTSQYDVVYGKDQFYKHIKDKKYGDQEPKARLD